MVKAWKSALHAVYALSGVVVTEDSSESDMIKKIVEEVLKELPRAPLHIKHQIELDSRIEDLKSLLDMESQDTLRMLCIYGVRKTDQTGFAVALFNKISDKFDAACFLANVSEKSKESINGLEELQKTLLSEMGHHVPNAEMSHHVPNAAMGSTFRGSSEIKQKLGHKRVLLILDDVDSVEQLDSLAGGSDWFGPGSRIIITTRDEDIASEDELYGVKIKKYFMGECEFEGKEDTESNDRQKRDVGEADVEEIDGSLLNIVLNASLSSVIPYNITYM